MQTLIDTTFSGKDISSAVSVYEYTIATSGMHSFQVRLASVAGDGNYTVYLTLNDGDAQTDDIMEPRTIVTLDSGQTAVWFETLKMPFIAGDVVNIFVLGQAGDTSESGSVRIFFEDYALATDVTVAISATTAASLSDNELALVKYYTFNEAITSTSTDAIDSADKIWFAVKENKDNDDDASLIFLEETDGLTIVNKTTYATPANGSLTLTGSSGAWVVTIVLISEIAGMLAAGTYYYEVKYSLSDAEYLYDSGTFYVNKSVIQEVV